MSALPISNATFPISRSLHQNIGDKLKKHSIHKLGDLLLYEADEILEMGFSLDDLRTICTVLVKKVGPLTPFFYDARRHYNRLREAVVARDLDRSQPFPALPLSAVPMSQRLRTFCSSMNVRTIGQLSRIRPDKMMKFDNVGTVTVTEANSLVKSYLGAAVV